MKKVAIMQPYLFPYLGYFQLLNAVDEFVLYNDVNHIVRGWINRNNYLVDGEKKLLSLSVIGASSNKLINELEFSKDFHKYLSTIEQSYSKAPYKEQVMPIIVKTLEGDNMCIPVVVKRSIEEIVKYLGFDNPKLLLSSEISECDQLRGQERVLTICKKLGADIYINPAGGKDLYDKKICKEWGVELKFIKPQLDEYKQPGDKFIPGLSIIDVMMFNSPEVIRGMLNKYELN